MSVQLVRFDPFLASPQMLGLHLRVDITDPDVRLDVQAIQNVLDGKIVFDGVPVAGTHPTFFVYGINSMLLEAYQPTSPLPFSLIGHTLRTIFTCRDPATAEQVTIDAEGRFFALEEILALGGLGISVTGIVAFLLLRR